MPNVLEVQIVGDVSSLQKSLKEAEKLQAEYTSSIEKTSKELSDNIVIQRNYAKAIDDLNKELKDGSISQKEYSTQLSKLKKDEQETTVVTGNLRKELANLKREQKDLGAGIQKDLTPKVANGGNALMQFSRIAQDAPFGIMGIGNNITATVEAFGHLQKQTGSTGEALKTVASSMLGSGGILLAVSLVTTGLTYMAQNGLSVEDVFSKLTGTFDENAKALSEVNAEAIKNSGAEIATMQANINIARDKTKSDEERLRAVKNLQEEYPAYFGNLSKEKILNGDIAGTIKDVTQALIARAKATALSSKIAELAEKEFLLRQDLRKEIKSLTKDYSLSASEAKKFNEQVLAGADAFQLLEPFKKRAGFFDVASAVASSNAVKDIGNEIIQNVASQKLFTKELEKSVVVADKFENKNKQANEDIKNNAKDEAKAKSKAEKEAERVRKALEDKASVKQISNPEIEVTARVTDIKLLTGKKDELGGEIKGLSELEIHPLVIPEPIDSEFIAGLERTKKAANIFSEATSSAIHSLGTELAQSLATGNSALDAFTGSLIQSLADIAAAQLQSLITEQLLTTQKVGLDQAKAQSGAIVSATETAKASGPAAAFVLPALVGAAIGFIAASFAGIKFAHGGVVPGGSFTGDKVPAMLNSGEAVMNRQQQANTLMAIANGNSNSLQSNQKGSNFTLDTVLRGSDLLLAIKREERKR